MEGERSVQARHPMGHQGAQQRQHRQHDQLDSHDGPSRRAQALSPRRSEERPAGDRVGADPRARCRRRQPARDIAGCRVSHAAAYRHYADKQALLADLAEAGFRKLVAINRRSIAATGGGPIEQLQACGRAYVRFGVRDPHLLQLMFGGAIVDWQAHA